MSSVSPACNLLNSARRELPSKAFLNLDFSNAPLVILKVPARTIYSSLGCEPTALSSGGGTFRPRDLEEENLIAEGMPLKQLLRVQLLLFSFSFFPDGDEVSSLFHHTLP